MIDKRLQASFWLSEFIDSPSAVRLGIDNMPREIEMAAIEAVLAPGMQRIRNLLRAPVIMSSAYRSPMLNAAVRGAKNSDHMAGLAADFTAPEFGTPRSVARHIMLHAGEIGFKQVILEFDRWVHVSFPIAGQRAPFEVLTASRGAGGETVYSKGIA